MSETGEQMGRCRREITAAYGSTRYKPVDSEMLIADAIDRLAADVAAVKAKVNDIMPEDVAHLVESEKAWVALVTEQRDAAIRERNAANQQRADTVRRLVQAQAEVAQLRDSRDVANRLFGAEQAKVERLRKELEQRQPAGNSPKTSDSSPAAPQPAGHGISPGLPETQSAGNAAPAAGWLTDEERELLALLKDTADNCSIVHSPWRCNWPYSRVSLVVNALLTRAGSPPSQTAPWWLTDEERRALSRAVHLLFSDDCDTPSAGTVQALLARAGSPPVVEVPPISERDVPKRNEARAYRAAMDKVGVAWKEVPRE